MTIYNFSAGPAVLPKAVLEIAQSEMLNYKNSGMSVMELSHRSSLFEEIIQSAESLLRKLMAIPDNYKVLFLQGGASLQFTMVPLNLAQGKKPYMSVLVHGLRKLLVQLRPLTMWRLKSSPLVRIRISPIFQNCRKLSIKTQRTCILQRIIQSKERHMLRFHHSATSQSWLTCLQTF